ncbi:MAG TPA: DUF2630 family protein [Acidimicrobiia bacterium]|nr:DUF2630 family protein [Acidimicrobiia bacterium]
MLSRIGELVDQDKQLRTSDGRSPPVKQDVERLEISIELDQCWDLLNQRRALREFGSDPGQARIRDEDTVEHYEQ